MNITISVPDHEVAALIKRILRITDDVQKPQQLALTFDEPAPSVELVPAQSKKERSGRGPKVTQEEVAYIELLNQAEVKKPSEVSKKLWSKLGIKRKPTGVAKIHQKARYIGDDGEEHYSWEQYQESVRRHHDVA